MHIFCPRFSTDRTFSFADKRAVASLNTREQQLGPEKHEQDAKELAAVKSDVGDMLLEYSRYHGREDLSLAISKVNDLLQISRLQKLKQSCTN